MPIFAPQPANLDHLSVKDARKNTTKIGSGDSSMWAYRFDRLWVPEEADEIFSSDEIRERAAIVRQWEQKMAFENARQLSQRLTSPPMSPPR